MQTTTIQRITTKAALLACAFGLFLAGCSKPQPAPASTSTSRTITGGDSAISGTITFNGTPPAPQPIDMTQDPGCDAATPGSAASHKHMSEGYVVSSAGGLANVLVYIKDVKSPRPTNAQPLVIDQRGCRYLPHVAAVQAGGTVEFRNSDPAMHNIHAPTFNESQMPGGKPVFRTFYTPGIMLPIQCNQHPWMKMYLNVMDSPYYSVTNADGAFSISGLPPGHYTLVARHELLGEKTLQFFVPAHAHATTNIHFSTQDVPGQ